MDSSFFCSKDKKKFLLRKNMSERNRNRFLIYECIKMKKNKSMYNKLDRVHLHFLNTKKTS